ncbi:MAG TPA: glycogen synthase GlgA [Acetobacteraceae bacterium]|nr:glycogen synthase GlgA [Acetobacteraceae bacterium]
MKVLSVGSEIYPLVKTGGLADVLGALPAALAAEGIETRTLVPGYPAVMAALDRAETVVELPDLFGGEAKILAAASAGLPLFVLDAPHLYARPGNPYADASGYDWADNGLRFAALARAAAEIGNGALEGFRPDIVHAHDWQAGLAPAYLHYAGGQRPRTVMTIHNLAYQGQFPAYLMGFLGLPPESYAMEGVEYYQSVGYLKAGLQFADAITTVSPSYAAELQTEAGGMGLTGLFRRRSAFLHGILNGIDTGIWNPERDSLIAARFATENLPARRENKAALQRRLGLAPEPETLLFAVVSRLAWQKGLDLLHDVLPVLEEMGAQLAVLGSGEAALEAAYLAAARARPERIACVIGFDEELAHLMQAGADAVLVPSRFEPCGLTQMIAQRYGAVPVVARVGGLADTVIDANEIALDAHAATGVQFAPVAAEMLAIALNRTARLWKDREAWRRMQRNGMKADFSWARPARHYAELYRGLLA